MSCPDNLLISLRKGTLSSEERERLDGHLAQCSSCRLTLTVGQDFDAVLDTSPGDDLIAARIARSGGRRALDTQARSPRRVSWVAGAAIGVLAGAGLAAAAVGGWRLNAEPAAPPEAPRPGVTARATAPRTAQPRSTEPPVAGGHAPKVTSPAPTAAELFAKANANRNGGQGRRALPLYVELQRRYPGSAEAEVSHVSLGRVLLDLDRSASALTQFERYLSRRPDGALAQEALFGKASALARLGRREEERRTWESLLERFPDSVYRDRAHERLERPR